MSSLKQRFYMNKLDKFQIAIRTLILVLKLAVVYIMQVNYQMQKPENLIAQMLSHLEGKNHQLQSIYVQKDIVNLLSKIPVCLEGFHLIRRLIFCYGIGVLLFMKPYYDKIRIDDLQDYEVKLKQIDAIVKDILQQNGYFGFSELSFFKFNDLTSSKKKKGKKENIFLQSANAKLINKSNKFRKHILALKSISSKIDKVKIGQSNIQDMTFFYNCFDELRNRELNIYDSMNYFQMEYYRYLLINIIKSLKSRTDQLPLQNYLRNHIERVTNIILESAKTGAQLKSFNTMEQINTTIDPTVNTKKLINNGWIQKDIVQRFAQKDTDQTQLRITIKDKKELDCKSQNPIKLSKIEHLSEIRRMCCRPYFIQGEMIQFPEDLRRQYKDYHFPLTGQHIQMLRKTIVGFLNAMGGIIYMGIKEEQNRIRKVFSVKLDQRQKQGFLFSFRNIVQAIEPQIIVHKLYSIKFVPVRSQKNLDIIPGRYIIKIIIEMGKPRELYTYLNSDGYNAAFRTENEVIGKDIKREFKKIYQIIKNRLLEPPRICEKEHEGKCNEPELGLPCYSKN